MDHDDQNVRAWPNRSTPRPGCPHQEPELDEREDGSYCLSCGVLIYARPLDRSLGLTGGRNDGGPHV